MGHRDIDGREAVTEQLNAEVRALFHRGFAGELVKLPRVEGLEVQREISDVTIADLIGNMEADWDHPQSVEARKAQHDVMLDGADRDHCVGRYREALIAFYLSWHGDDLVDHRVGALEYDAAEDRAIAREWWAA